MSIQAEFGPSLQHDRQPWDAPSNVHLANATPTRFGWSTASVMCAVHTYLVLTHWIGTCWPDGIRTWMPFVCLDFPVGMFPLLTQAYLPDLSVVAAHTLLAVQFALVGGLQWFIIAGWTAGLSGKYFAKATSSANADLVANDSDKPLASTDRSIYRS